MKDLDTACHPYRLFGETSEREIHRSHFWIVKTLFHLEIASDKLFELRTHPEDLPEGTDMEAIGEMVKMVDEFMSQLEKIHDSYSEETRK